MTIGGLLLGVINIGIVVVLLLLFGVIAKWILSACGFAPPPQVDRLYLLFVGLVALYMLVALFFGLPTVTILPFRAH